MTVGASLIIGYTRSQRRPHRILNRRTASRHMLKHRDRASLPRHLLRYEALVSLLRLCEIWTGCALTVLTDVKWHRCHHLYSVCASSLPRFRHVWQRLSRRAGL